jgi:V/A-type H+-transporting ATPase subunit A
MYCAPAKQVGLLKLIMLFYERSLACVKAGAPLLKINALPVRERLARLKSDIRNDDVGAVADFERELRSQTEELERGYRGKEAV